ncbi:MAG: hypothetical protein LBU88_04740 [Treponema sp.]|jgi:hypothetical protein|nr:hypothetical protein [Treponema sp.]
MEQGQLLLIMSQLGLGAIATFLAIMLWSRTRDAAWMLIIIGAIVAYIEIVYDILETFGMSLNLLLIGSVPAVSFVLPLLRMVFFITAFLVMIIKQSRLK